MWFFFLLSIKLRINHKSISFYIDFILISIKKKKKKGTKKMNKTIGPSTTKFSLFIGSFSILSDRSQRQERSPKEKLIDQNHIVLRKWIKPLPQPIYSISMKKNINRNHWPTYPNFLIDSMMSLVLTVFCILSKIYR